MQHGFRGNKMLFSKEFLQKVEDRSDKICILDFLMYHQKKSFHDGIKEICEFCGLELEYIKK